MTDLRDTGAASFLGGGEMAARIGAFDWSGSLGPIEYWPQSLKTIVGFMMHTPVPLVLLWGADGIMIYNDGYSVFAGSRHLSLLGSKVREGWPEVADFNDNVMKVGLAGGTLSYKDQELALNRSGTLQPAWMNLDYSPVIDESGKPGGVMAIVVEVTERVLAERRVQVESATLAQMFQNTPSFICQLDGPEHVYTFANAAYQQLIAHRDVIGKTIRAALPDIAGQGFYELLDRVYASGESFAGSAVAVTLQRRPGAEPEQRFLDFIYQPVRDAGGHVTGIFTEGTDVTDAVQGAAALRVSEQRLQTALSAGRGIGTWDWDVRADKVVADHRFARLYGVDPARAAVGAPIAEFFASIHPDDVPQVQRDVDRTVQTGERFNAVYRLIQPDGRVRWVEAEGECGHDADGAPLHFTGFTFDVTEKMEAQAAIRENENRRAALVALGDRIRDIEDPEELAFAAAQILGEALGVSRAGYGTIDPKAETITIARDWNAPGIASLAGTLHFRDYGSYIEDLKRGETVVIADAFQDPRSAGNAAALKAISAQAIVNMPMAEDGGLVALLYLNHATARDWAVEELAFIRDFALRTRTAVQRRRAEADLRASESQFRGFAQAVPNHVWAAGPDGMLNWFNERVHEYSGAGPGALNGTGWTSMVHPDDLNQAAARWGAALASGAVYEAEFRLRRADGVYRWHLARAVPSRDAAGAVTGWIGTNTDIEDQNTALTALRELRDELEQRVAERTEALQIFRTFYTYSSEFHAMLYARDDGAFVYEEINPATLKLYGMQREDVIGRSVDEVFGPEMAAVLNSHLLEAMQDGKPHRYTRQQKGAAIEAVATPIPAEPGARRRLTVTARDISDRLGLEEQLRQAQKMEAVGQLTGGIAHDFNNLLQGITGALDRVQYRLSEGRTHDVDRFLKAAIESANRAAALTHRLLAFSRRQTLDPRPLDANRLIGGMEELLRRTMGPNVAMEVVGAGGVWPIRADGSQLENALLNLCINARDAMPEGGKLTIETANKWLDERAARERELPPGQYVSLCVTDTGTGMSEEVIARAFDPFFTTKPLGRGTGLGLSMIYGFVRQSGGQVRIYSEVGKGTTMCLYFPRYQGEVDADSAARHENVERGFGETVLVVDDEATVRMLIAEVLSESYYNILEAGDGPAALKILETGKRVDLLITDVGLPGGMNGRQVADAARVLRPGLKVLFITGYAENAAIGNGHLDAGMEILAKPFAMSTLGSKVREMIES